ncbi:MAG TPA: hypothetical protein PK890_04070, partial [Terrimesophilobacter sp.]|nr:hypothetical protein [Terrimesophilobacter sp.]
GATVDRSLAIYPLRTVHATDTASFPGEDEVSEPPTLTAPDSEAEARMHVVADPSTATRAELVAGQWPASGETAVPQKTADLFDIAVGDLLLVGEGNRAVTLTVSGLWSPLDATDPYWMGDQAMATGEGYPAGDGTRGFGPLVVDEPTLLTFGIVPTARWTIVPDASTITPTEWVALDGAFTGLREEIRALPDGLGAASVLAGALPATTAQVLTGLGAIRGVTPVGVALVGILGLVTLVQLARLLSIARRPETALLRSRGASAAWLTTVSSAEAFVVAVLGAGVGVVAATGVLHLLFGDETFSVLPWPYAAVVAAVVLTVLGLTAWRESARISRRDTVDDSGRARTVTTVAGTVLALAAAGVAVWQSLFYGSPLVTDAAGRPSVNPLAVLAPALCLIAGALLVLLLLAPLSRVAEAAAARSRKLQPAYSVRQVARGLVSYSAAVLVIALTSGGVVVAAGYAATWQGLSGRTAHVATGADALVKFEGLFVNPTNHPDAIDEYTLLPGVADASRILAFDASVGDPATFIAIPAGNLPLLTASAGGVLDGEALADLLTPTETDSIALPADAVALSVDVEYSAPRVPFPPEYPQELIDQRLNNSITLSSEVWIQDAAGTLARIELGSPTIRTDGVVNHFTHRVELPEGVAPWTLEGFDAHSAPTGLGSTSITFSHVRAHGSDAAPDDPGETIDIDFRTWSQWFTENIQFDFNFDSFDSSATSITSNFRLDLKAGTARVAPGGDGFGWRQPFVEMPTTPIIIDERLAQHLSIGVGDDLVVGARNHSVAGKVAALVPFVPGTTDSFAIIADLPSLNVQFIRSIDPIPSPNGVLVTSDGTIPLSELAAQLAAVGGPDVTVTTVDDLTQSAFPLPAELALWVAAAASLALATISLGAVTLTVARSRKGEVGVLRAVGVHAGAQARARFVEVTLIVLTSIVAGALVGWGTAALTVPGLARSVVVGVPAGLTTPLGFAWRSGGILLAVAASAALIIALVYATRVRAQALNTDERLETR